MRALAASLLLASALGAAGCAKKGSLVLVHITSAQQIDNVASLAIKVTADNRIKDLALQVPKGALVDETFGVDVANGVTGTIYVDVTADDAGGTPIIEGAASAEIVPGGTATLELVLGVVQPPPDMAGGDGPTPSFSIASAPPTLVVAQGKAADLTLTLTRGDGFSQGVDVSVEGLPTGVTGASLTIPPGSTTATLTITAAASAAQMAAPASATVRAKSSGLADQTSTFMLRVIGPPGSIDTTFGTSGAVHIDGGNLAPSCALTVMPDDRFVVQTGSFAAYALLRYSKDGVQDTTLATGSNTFGTSTDTANGVLVQPDGNIVGLSEYEAFDSMTSAFDYGIQIGRWTPTGAFDTTFNATGKLQMLDVKTMGTKGQVSPSGVARDPDGRLLVVSGEVGDANPYFGVTCFDTMGATCAGFGTNGRVTIPPSGGINSANAIAIQSDKKIVLTGFAGVANTGSSYNVEIVRLTTAGAVDPGWNTGSPTYVDPLGAEDIGFGVAIDATGLVYVAGLVTQTSAANQDVLLLRLTSAGVLDNAFGTNGKVITSLDEGSSISQESAKFIAIAPSGQILVGGGRYKDATTQNDVFVARYNGATLDAAFGNGGKSIIDVVPGNYDFMCGMGVQSDGKPLILSQTATSTGAVPHTIVVQRLWN